MDKLDIKNEMAQFDLKNRNFYNELTIDEKKKFSNYLMIRWGSTVYGSSDLQEYYLLSTNEKLNKHFFALNKFPQLQWLCATTVSPGLGEKTHAWIKLKSKVTNNKIEKFLLSLYPTMKLDELKMLASLTTNAELKEMAKEMGMTKEQIKKELG